MSDAGERRRPVERFEDLIAWQKAKILARMVYEATQGGAFPRDFGFTSQIQRASVSIMSNIAEGYERDSRPESFRFLTIAKASCAEVRSLIYLAHDIGYLDEPSFQRLLSSANEVARIIGGLRTTVRRLKQEKK